MELSINIEAISLMFLLLIMIFHHDRSSTHNKYYRVFRYCLVLSGLSSVFNIITCILIADVVSYPYWLHMVMNSLYFIAIFSCFSLMAIHTFARLLQYIPGQKCLKIVVTIIGALWGVLMILVLVNIWTGCYFYFENDTYMRGPLNKLGFCVLFLEVIMLCACYFKNRKYVSPYAIQLVRVMPVVIVVLAVLQLLMPDTLLTGTIAAVASLVLYISFQNNRIGRDALTELQNRTCFFKELIYRKEKGRTCHVILVDIKDLDRINKRVGMKNGDALLYNVARFLEHAAPGYRTYRFSNKCFVLLGNFNGSESAKAVSDKIFTRFADRWIVKEYEVMLQIQLVHLGLLPEEVDENKLIEQLNYMLSESTDIAASTNMYFDEKVKGRFERKMHVLNEVKKALENDAFTLYYQPIYSCTEKKFTSVEVLLRLFTESGEFISPAEFIPLAEENGLIEEISWMVLKKSGKFLSENTWLPIEGLSINMTVQQLIAPYIYDKIEWCKQNYGNSAKMLQIEITERVISENPEFAKKVMENLIKIGVRFNLDDFGVGYSNFAGVFEYPFHAVKIDRSLCIDIERDEQKYRTLKYLVGMLHNVGFKVVAEGIETKEQLDKIIELSVDKVQGFYFAKPMDGEHLIEFYKKQGK